MYVLDAYAVLELEVELPSRQPRLDAFTALSKLVTDGELVFPDAVLKECKTFAHGEVATVWLLGVAGSRKSSSFPGSMPMEVLGICPGLLAPEWPGEQSQIDVACLAKMHSQAGCEVVVVTEDPGIGGDRITLGEACDMLGLTRCGVKKMLAELGLPGIRASGGS